MSKNNFLGILVIVLVFGMMVPACANQVDRSLNGTWVYEEKHEGEDAEVPLEIRHEVTFNNGNFEMSNDGQPVLRGRYATDNGKFTLTTTHVHGLMLGYDSGFESRWYSRNEIKSAFVPSRVSEEEFDQLSFTTLELFTYNYSVDGYTLTLIIEGEPPLRFIKSSGRSAGTRQNSDSNSQITATDPFFNAGDWTEAGDWTDVGVWANAGYWKDGVWHALSLPREATDSRTSGITVSGDVVYISGSYSITGMGGDDFACYWRNGVINILSIPSGATSPQTSGIAVSGDIVYVTGSYRNAQNIEIACYWRNGVINTVSIPGGARGSSTSGIVVSGDVVYIAGSYRNAQHDNIASYWRNGVLNTLNIPSGARNSSADGIAVSGDVVYIAGFYRNAQYKEIACYWRNRELQNLNIPSEAISSSAIGITISGDVVYVTGSYNIADFDYIATYWRNGELHNVSLPSVTDLIARVIAVSGDIVYIAGSGNFFNPTVCYWENGVVHNLMIPVNFQDKYVRITGIAVFGDSVYITNTFWMQ